MNREQPEFWNKPYVLLLFVNTIAYLGFQALAPLIPVYATRFDATESQIGFLAASVSLAALLIRPVSGLLADRGNSKRIILITQFVTVVVVASFIIAPNISALIALRFFHGFLFGVSSTVIMTAVVRVIPEAQMGRGIGLLSMTSIGSQAVAPAFGIELSDRFGYPAFFSAASAIAGIAGFLAFVLRDARSAARRSGDAALKKPVPAAGGKAAKTGKRKISRKDIFAFEALGLTVLVTFFTAVPSTITNFLVVFGNDRGIAGIGYYFTIYAVVLIGVRGFCGSLIDRYPYRRIVYVCTAFCIAGPVLVGIARSFAPLAAAALLLGVGYGVVLPALQTAIVRGVPEERRGVAGATFYIGMDAGYVGGSVAMGFIAELLGYSAGFFALCVPLLAAIPLTLHCARADRGREKPQDKDA